MKDGFVKVAVGTPKIRVADCVYNAEAISSMIREAEQNGAKMLALPELCVTGYTCGDLFCSDSLLDAAEDALVTAAGNTGDLLALVGAPVRFGNRLYSCAVAMNRGKIIAVVPKIFIPNYCEFYEARHFSSGEGIDGEVTIGGETVPFGAKTVFECRAVPSFAVGVEICEDLWSYLPPSTNLAAAGATVIANLSASDEIASKADFRRRLVEMQSSRLMCCYADAGEGESTTDLVFAGHDLIAENGSILAESRFENRIIYTEADVLYCTRERRRITTFPPRPEGYRRIAFEVTKVETVLTRTYRKTPFVPGDPARRSRRCEEIITIQALGLKKRVEHTNAKSLVIGLSGGLDSTLALLISVRVMDMLDRPRTDVLGVTMPCFGTTKRTRSNAELLAERLGISFRTVDITAAVTQHFADISHDMENHNVVFENGQARERTQVIMDIANENGGLVVGTGDLSESALGWSTYNGDHMSMYGVNASIPKTLVRYLVGYFADETDDPALASTLRDILATPVSPELLPAKDGEISQKTEELVGPYELHDFFIYYFVRRGFSAEKLRRIALLTFDGTYDAETVDKWLNVFMRRFFAQQFKRSCMPDGPKVGSVSLSPRGDWRMPSDAVNSAFRPE